MRIASTILVLKRCLIGQSTGLVEQTAEELCCPLPGLTLFEGLGRVGSSTDTNTMLVFLSIIK